MGREEERRREERREESREERRWRGGCAHSCATSLAPDAHEQKSHRFHSDTGEVARPGGGAAEL